MSPRAVQATSLLMEEVLQVLRQLLHTLKSVLIAESIDHLIAELRGCYRSLTGLLHSTAKFVPGGHYLDQSEHESAPTQQCRLSREDVKVVVERLGMVRRSPADGAIDAGHDECVEVLDEMLEEKEASEEELREAFYVFDRNEDGYITAGELWCVMRRLGLPEGVRLDDCERMIRAFDDDGDGRISFWEFRKLMENAT